MDYTKRYGTKYRDEFFPDKINDLVANDGHLNIVPQLRQHSDYLYETKFDNLDYKFAEKYMNKHYAPIGCTAIHAGNFCGDNLDYFYNYSVEFIVRVPPSAKRYASTAICSDVPELTKDFVEKGDFCDSYRILPFYVSSGLNEMGLFVKVNVVPTDCGITTGSKTINKARDILCSTMLPRYILDNYATPDEAVEDIKNNVSVYANKALLKLGYDCHFMIANKDKAYILEFVDNEPVIIESDIMTNFFLDGVEFDDNGKVTTPEEGNPIEINHITPHGAGLERWNIVVDNFNNLNSKETVLDLLHNKLDYRKAYETFPEVSNPYWYSELVGRNSKTDLMLDGKEEDFQYMKEQMGILFAHRDRTLDTKGTWHTMHTAVYDLIRKKIYLYDSTEDGVLHTFTFKKYYTAEEIDAIIEELINNK